MMGVNIQVQPKIQNSSDRPAIDHKSQAWYIEYMGVLFESDRKLLGSRIQHARHLIIKRERELFSENTCPAEQRSLNNALHALEALRMCLGL